MPHATIKLWPGKSEAQKEQLAAKITEAIVETLESKEESVSVTIVEVEKENWGNDVYKPDIMENEAYLYKKPGYQMTFDA